MVFKDGVLLERVALALNHQIRDAVRHHEDDVRTRLVVHAIVHALVRGPSEGLGRVPLADPAGVALDAAKVVEVRGGLWDLVAFALVAETVDGAEVGVAGAIAALVVEVQVGALAAELVVVHGVAAAVVDVKVAELLREVAVKVTARRKVAALSRLQQEVVVSGLVAQRLAHLDGIVAVLDVDRVGLKARGHHRDALREEVHPGLPHDLGGPDGVRHDGGVLDDLAVRAVPCCCEGIGAVERVALWTSDGAERVGRIVGSLGAAIAGSSDVGRGDSEGVSHSVRLQTDTVLTLLRVEDVVEVRAVGPKTAQGVLGRSPGDLGPMAGVVRQR